MAKKEKTEAPARFIAEWTLSSAATLGSSVRAKGILQEIQARLPWSQRKAVTIRAGTLSLRMPEEHEDAFSSARLVIEQALEHIESLPILPREIEDILGIKTSERHRWLKDGRLPSAGTRTVRLRGRARQITFHVFDPRRVEDILDDDQVASWREDDALAAAENRRNAAWKRRLKRAESTAPTSADTDPHRPQLIGWDEFERDGPL